MIYINKEGAYFNYPRLANGVGCFLVCFVLSWQVYGFLEQYLLDHVKAVKTVESKHVANLEVTALEHMSNSVRDAKCFKDILNGENEFDKCQSNKSAYDENIGSKQKKDQLKTPLIRAIEWLLILSISVQLFLAFYVIFLCKNKIFDRYIFRISDWAINTPPILGVLANLLSFALMLSKGGKTVEALFSSNYFFEAIVTTLIGGLFYIFNLALNIVIQPYFESKG